MTDAAVIATAAAFLARLTQPAGTTPGSPPPAAMGGDGRWMLHINSLGTPQCQARYVQQLAAFLQPHASRLSPDSQLRLARGAALRVLDSKHPADAAVCADAPRLTDALSAEAAARYHAVLGALTALGIRAAPTLSLVRGLDYYRHTIFEVAAPPDTSSAAHGQGGGGASAGGLTVLAGGRYDELPAALGGPAGVRCMGECAHAGGGGGALARRHR
jgi:histidyl-tRNA synthetase